MPPGVSSIPKPARRLPVPQSSVAPGPRKKTVPLSIPSMKAYNAIRLVDSDHLRGHKTPSSRLPKSPVLTAGNTLEVDKRRRSNKPSTLSTPQSKRRIISNLPAITVTMPSPTTPPPSAGLKLAATSSPPSAPQKQSSGLHLPAPGQSPDPIKKSEPPYIAAHLGQSCTHNALDHRLTCGHKVITHEPKLCGSNCQISHSDHANPRSLDDGPFACLTCIVAAHQVLYGERVKTYKEEMEHVAKNTEREDPEEYFAAKLEFVLQTWKEARDIEIIAEAKKGRFCHPVFVNPENDGVLKAVVERMKATTKTKV